MSFLDEVKVKIKRISAYHMTHIDNLPKIFSEDALISKAEILKRKFQFNDISCAEVQGRRESKIVNNLGLHEYVPLYFGPKTPMVAANNFQQEKIIFLLFDLTILQTPGCVISDGNAASDRTKFKVFSQLSDLDILNINAIATSKYGQYTPENEQRRKKQAEVLIPNKLPLKQMLRILVFSSEAAGIVLAQAKKIGKRNPQVSESKGWYFLQKNEGNK